MTAPMTPERLDEIRDLIDDGATERELRAALIIALAELDRLHSWHGLMSLLDEHWPDWLFITKPDPDDYHEPLYVLKDGEYVRANPGVWITGLIRWVERLRAQVKAIEDLHQRVEASTVSRAWCNADDFDWPCATAAVLSSYDERNNHE